MSNLKKIKKISKVLVAGFFLLSGIAQATESEVPINKLLLLDIEATQNQIFAVGDRGYILHSSDQGESWVKAESPTQQLLTALAQSPNGNLYAVGHESVILKSTDDGKTWVAQSLGDEQSEQSQPAEPLLDVHFLDDQTGYAVGGFGYAYKTTDAGKNWQDITYDLPNEEGFHLNKITSDEAGNIAIVGEAGLIMHSPDRGENWNLIDIPYEGTLFGGLITSNNKLIVYGLRGNAFVSDNFSGDWQKLNIEETSTFFGGAITEQGRLLLVGDNGVIFHGSDFAQPLSLTRQENRLPISSLLVINNNELILVGMSGISKRAIN